MWYPSLVWLCGRFIERRARGRRPSRPRLYRVRVSEMDGQPEQLLGLRHHRRRGLAVGRHCRDHLEILLQLARIPLRAKIAGGHARVEALQQAPVGMPARQALSSRSAAIAGIFRQHQCLGQNGVGAAHDELVDHLCRKPAARPSHEVQRCETSARSGSALAMSSGPPADHDRQRSGARGGRPARDRRVDPAAPRLIEQPRRKARPFATEIVEKSTSTLAGRMAAATPSLPNMTVSTASIVGS